MRHLACSPTLWKHEENENLDRYRQTLSFLREENFPRQEEDCKLYDLYEWGSEFVEFELEFTFHVSPNTLQIYHKTV